jgi:hypothetical protein
MSMSCKSVGCTLSTWRGGIFLPHSLPRILAWRKSVYERGGHGFNPAIRAIDRTARDSWRTSPSKQKGRPDADPAKNRILLTRTPGVRGYSGTACVHRHCFIYGRRGRYGCSIFSGGNHERSGILSI